MAAQRPLFRIVLNVVLDFLLAALAVPIAHVLADPLAVLGGAWAAPPWLPAAGAALLLLAGLPFRLSQQYWRFAGIGDLISIQRAGCGSACPVL